MTVREAEQKFNLPARTLRELLASKLLYGEKVDGVWNVDPQALEAFLYLSRRSYQKEQDKSLVRQAAQARQHSLQSLQQFVQKVQNNSQPARPSWRGSDHWAPPGNQGGGSSFSDNERNRYGWD